MFWWEVPTRRSGLALLFVVSLLLLQLPLLLLCGPLAQPDQKLWKDVAQEIKMVLVTELLLVISALSCYLCLCYETRKKPGAGGRMRRTAIKLRLCVCCRVSSLFPPHLPLKNPTYLAICVPTAKFVPK